LTEPLRAPEHVHWKRFDSELVVLNLSRGEYYGLSDVGAEAFEQFARGQTRDEVVHALLGQFKVDRPTLELDLDRLLEDFVAQGLLVGAPT
jgi:hypothetical protein